MLELDYASSDDSVSASNSKPTCEMCGKNSRLYKCPRCSMFTCSLECCRDHKTKTECSGVRDRTEFVLSRNFKEAHLKSDYHFLEDVLQTKDRAKRTLAQNCGGDKKPAVKKRNKNSKKEEAPQILDETYQRLDSYSKSVKSLYHAAKERGTKLILMPNGMTKRTLNKSLYNAKENTINWKVFVVFITSSNYVKDALFRVDLESTKASQKLSFAQESLIGISIDAVNENKTLDEIFEQFMQPTVENAAHRHALRSLRLNKSAIRCLMHRIPSPNNNPVFLEPSMGTTLKDALAGQTIIEYPTLYFGSYEHTASLQTLIADPAVEAGRSSGGDSNSVGSSGRKTGITELAGGAAASSEAEDERMDVISADEPQSSTRKSVSFLEVSSSRFKASSAPERAVSKELLNIEMDTDDAIKNSSSAFPNTKFNSSNVADIVSNMKHFIDATLCAKANEKEEGEEEEEAVGAVDGIPTPTLRALGNLGGLGGFNFPASASRPAAVSNLLGGVGIGARQGVGVEEELGMEEGEVDDDEGEEGEEENEEFLAMLKELADKDIDTLRAIIAAEEACGEEEGYDSEDDT